MDFESVFAGIEPGGMTDIYEIKILICYLLNSLKEPLTKEQMDQVLQGNRLVNYFSYASAYKELLESGHVYIEERGGRSLLRLNELGQHTALLLKSNLPLSVKDKVVSAGMEILAEMKRDRERDVAVEQVENGYMVRLTVHDDAVDLLDIRIFAPDMEQVEIIKKQFMQNTLTIYKGVISLLIRDGQGLRRIAEEYGPAKAD